jgi:hypothetical protein
LKLVYRFLPRHKGVLFGIGAEPVKVYSYKSLFLEDLSWFVCACSYDLHHAFQTSDVSVVDMQKVKHLSCLCRRLYNVVLKTYRR